MEQYLHMNKQKRKKSISNRQKGTCREEISIQKTKTESMYTNMEHTYFIQVTKKYGNI